MRIVQALGSSRRGGAERFFTRLARSFHEAGVAQRVLVRGGHWVEAQLIEAGVPVDRAHFGGTLDVFTRLKFRRVLAEYKADIALTWMRRAASACPKGSWLHVGRLGNYYDLKAFGGCDHLIANTPGIADYIRNAGWPAERVSYIPNFVPVTKADPVPRAALDTPAGVPLILWLGRMEREKGPDIVVRALAKTPEAWLWMAGDGSMFEEVKRLAAEIGVAPRIRFLGWRDDIHALLASADIFAFASRFEALGNGILEAWSHGVPVVAARSPGPEHLISHGETGFLVANDNPDAMADALKVLLDDANLRNTLSKMGYNHFLNTYSEDAIRAQYLVLFRSLLSSGRRGVA
jgi:glycosyltransferase involved in cell wall biosynthesis